MGKNPISSKTLWVNVIGIIAMLVQTQTGYIIDPALQTGILGIINLILRIITREPLDWSKGSDDSGSSGLSSLGMCLLAIMIFSGCAHTKTDTREATATKTMLAMKEGIIAIAVTVDQMCELGTLNQKQCDRVADVYQKAMVTYDFAADALAVALANKAGSGTWAVYQSHHNAFLKLFQDMYNIAFEFKLIPAIEGGAR